MTDNTQADSPTQPGLVWGRRTAGGLAVLSFLLTAAAFLQPDGRLEWFLGPSHMTVSAGPKPIVVTLLLVGVWALLRYGGPRTADRLGRVFRSNAFRKPALALVMVTLFFGGAELILRIVGFEAELPTIVIRGETGPDGTNRFTIPDPELRWRLNPGVEFNGRAVNSMGFLDREVDPVKAPGMTRVICLGDSCTGQGIPPYSGFLHQRLVEDPPTDAPWEAFNMGVHGYSSVQGLRLFQRQGQDLHPDLVSIYYGWNDHWLGGQTDSEAMPWGMSELKSEVVEKLRETRVFQAMVHLLRPPHRREAAPVSEGDMVLRVPPDEYRWTLERLVREIQGVGAVPVLLTAPRAETLTSLLVRNGQTRDLQEVIALHDQYNDIVRQLAVEQTIPLVDLAVLFSGPESAPLFADDGIHLRREARIRIADELHTLLETLVEEGTLR